MLHGDLTQRKNGGPPRSIDHVICHQTLVILPNPPTHQNWVRRELRAWWRCQPPQMAKSRAVHPNDTNPIQTLSIHIQIWSGRTPDYSLPATCADTTNLEESSSLVSLDLPLEARSHKKPLVGVVFTPLVTCSCETTSSQQEDRDLFLRY
jgi:hypothetical protein